jgi:hypothetical protein
MSFDQNGQPVFGVLGTDRPNQFKAQFIYQLPFGTSIGMNGYVASGIPVTREIGVLPTSNFPVQYLGRESDGRMPWFSQFDLSLNHAFRMGGSRQLQLEFNIINLFNQRTATNRFVTMQKSDGISFDEKTFYEGKVDFPSLIAKIPLDPRFLLDSGFQTPLTARVGVRFLF